MLVAALWRCTWGRVQEGAMALALLSAGFQSLPLLPTIKLGPWCCFLGGWVCVHSRTQWVSPMNSPVSLGVSPTAASTPTDVFSQWFEALFPHTGILGCLVCHLVHQLLPLLPAAALPTLLHSPLLCWVCQPPPCRESSPPFLPVWMNVSSLTPWLSDFHTVRFSVSSGCFLFLNCCCPSFGWVRRHSVSTYASILAGSPWPRNLKTAHNKAHIRRWTANGKKQRRN